MALQMVGESRTDSSDAGAWSALVLDTDRKPKGLSCSV